MKVKICGITNLEDALAAVAAGADAIGFNFYSSSPRFIQPSQAQEIIHRLPKTLMCVGVFVNETDSARIAGVADQLGLAAVQLHGDESPEYCRALQGLFVIKALRVGEHFDPQNAKAYETNAILLDAYVSGVRGGTGNIIDWEMASEVAALVPRLILAGGLSDDNVAQAIAAVAPYGVDACSRLEISPRKKDATRMRLFVAAARAAHVKP